MSTKSKRGFASMDKEMLREISSKGGSARVTKGFASMDKETHLKVSRLGGSRSRRGIQEKQTDVQDQEISQE